MTIAIERTVIDDVRYHISCLPEQGLPADPPMVLGVHALDAGLHGGPGGSAGHIPGDLELTAGGRSPRW